MMLPTHALGGMLLALPLVFLAPEFAGVALVAGFLGGVFPDLDMYAGHRRALHYPVYYPAVAGAAALLAASVPTAASVGAAAFLLAAAAHSVSDVFGGGLELRPWEGTSDRAVYDHHRGRWIAPRRWIPYDGSPEDLLLSVTAAVPLLAVLGGVLRWVAASAVAVAAVYTAVRRFLPTVAERLVGRLPDGVLTHVPARYLTERRAVPGDRGR